MNLHTLSISNRTLGLMGLVGAPFLFAMFYLPTLYPALNGTPFSGLCGLVYMIGWMASLVGLWRLGATGQSAFGRFIIILNLITLAIANIYNVLEAIGATNSVLFRLTDLCWPGSNIIALPVGIMVAVVGALRGWRRYVPLAVGLWFPLTMLLMGLLGKTTLTLILPSVYSTVSWSLLAIVVLTTPRPEKTLWFA